MPTWRRSCSISAIGHWLLRIALRLCLNTIVQTPQVCPKRAKCGCSVLALSERKVSPFAVRRICVAFSFFSAVTPIVNRHGCTIGIHAKSVFGLLVGICDAISFAFCLKIKLFRAFSPLSLAYIQNYYYLCSLF